MSYDVHFKAKLEGVDQWVYVGADWISHTGNHATLIKEVCGSYPSSWDGKPATEMLPVLRQGIDLLRQYPQRYSRMETSCWDTVESVLAFLIQIEENCSKYPTSVLEVCC